MCNLYSQTKSQDAMRHVFDDMRDEGEDLIDTTGNLPAMTGIFPDYAAPIIRHGAKGGVHTKCGRAVTLNLSVTGPERAFQNPIFAAQVGTL